MTESPTLEQQLRRAALAALGPGPPELAERPRSGPARRRLRRARLAPGQAAPGHHAERSGALAYDRLRALRTRCCPRSSPRTYLAARPRGPGRASPTVGRAGSFDQYFTGARHTFELPIELAADQRLFSPRCWRRPPQIPYGGVAELPRGGRARSRQPARARARPGNALGSNPLPIVVPCHRVVLHSGGGLGGYTGGLERKRALLAHRARKGTPRSAGAPPPRCAGATPA